MGTGLKPFVGAAACSYDLPLGALIRIRPDPTDGPNPTVSVDGAAFTVPDVLICLDRFGRPTRNRRVDVVLLFPADPGRTELALARAWGARSFEATVHLPPVPWTPPVARSAGLSSGTVPEGPQPVNRRQ